ncbi:DUF3293 domain-containing protein [Lewinella sp. 4G2]|uniref:DUF3293 domain-containing protein n=1 Tax=Lewinella sp. 4G2 TaxID=1803372 RepID=UPI0012FAFF4D|nr:DUF3293 domain-containing protein [Lewinella sp. 4G2]
MHLPGVAPAFHPALHREYCASVYVCHNFRLRSGSPNASFTDWIAARGYSSYAFLTAYNPYSNRQLSRADNLALAQVLRNRIKDLAIDAVPAAAVDVTGTWPEEVGLMLLGVDLGTALQLGREFQQNAILYGKTGNAAAVLWCECRLPSPI